MAFPTPPHYPDTPPADAPDNRSFEPMEDAWPEWLFQIPGTQLTRKDVDQIRSDLSAFKRSVAEDAPRESIGSDERLYPARLLIVDTGLRNRQCGLVSLSPPTQDVRSLN